jgi:hypothetical protein
LLMDFLLVLFLCSLILIIIILILSASSPFYFSSFIFCLEFFCFWFCSSFLLSLLHLFYHFVLFVHFWWLGSCDAAISSPALPITCFSILLFFCMYSLREITVLGRRWCFSWFKFLLCLCWVCPFKLLVSQINSFSFLSE